MESPDGAHVLKILVGRVDFSVPTWHRTCEDILSSKGTVRQSDDGAYSLAYSRAVARGGAAISINVAHEAARQTIVTGARPTAVDFQERSARASRDRKRGLNGLCTEPSTKRRAPAITSVPFASNRAATPGRCSQARKPARPSSCG